MFNSINNSNNSSSGTDGTDGTGGGTGGGHSAEEPRLLPLVTGVLLALMAVLGAAGNALVLACLLRMSQLRHLTHLLVGNLSAVGLLSCLVTIPGHVSHLAPGGSQWQDRHPAACKVLAHLNFGLVLCTLVNSAAIALCRYRTVTAKHGTRHPAMPALRIVRLLAFTWAFPTLVTLSASPFLGFNALLWDCFLLDADKAFWFLNAALAVPAVVSTLCMLVSYVLIVKKVRESRMKVSNLCPKPLSLADNAGPESREEKSESEVRKDNKEGHTPGLAGVPGPSSLTVIKIFTTMIPDTPAPAMPSSTSCGVEKSYTPAPLPPHPTPDTTDADKRPSPASSQGPAYLLLPAAPHPSPSPHELAARHSGKGMDSLSVPSRSASSMSQDTLSSAREDSVLSSSFSTSTSTTTVTQCQQRWRRKRRRVRKEVKLSLHLFLAFFLFCLLYLPLCLAHVLHAFHAVGREAWLLLYTLALSFASNAWLVYALLNHDFRRAFRALLQGRRSF